MTSNTPALSVEVELDEPTAGLIERARAQMGGGNYDAIIITLAVAGAQALLVLADMVVSGQ